MDVVSPTRTKTSPERLTMRRQGNPWRRKGLDESGAAGVEARSCPPAGGWGVGVSSSSSSSSAWFASCGSGADLSSSILSWALAWSM